MKQGKCHSVFEDDFRAQLDGTYPAGWLLERHSDLLHDLAEIRGGVLRILFPGNLHLPLIPPVGTGAVSFTARGDVYSAGCALNVFFRYDPSSRAGYCIRHSWSRQGMETVFGVYEDGDYTTLERVVVERSRFVESLAEERRLRLEMGACEFALFHEDECVARFCDPATRFAKPGRIALDRGLAREAYVVEVLRFRIDSDEPEAARPIWSDRVFELPSDLNGITDSWRFEISAARGPHRARLDIAIAGGPAHRPASVCDFSGLRGNSRLTRPYVRVESGAGGGAPERSYLHTGSLGLKEHWQPRSSGDLPCDSEGPERRTLLFSSLPDDAWLALGYEHYEAEDRLALAGGPAEMLVCPQTGAVLYAGPALDSGATVLEVVSPTDKKMAGMIPAGELRRDRALAFARNNHFFFESEPVRFTVRFRQRGAEDFPADLVACVTLEDAFQTPLEASRRVAFHRDGEALSEQLHARLGVATLISPPVEFSGLRVGVYHVRVEVRRGTQRLLEIRRAFEVLSDDPAHMCPPLASGLPDLIPQIPDYATETGAFDPWVGQGVNAAHYLANCSHHVLPARENRIWDVVHLYRRRWVLELSRRMTPAPKPEQNADVVQHADRVYWNLRHDLWRGGYDTAVLEALVKFIRQLVSARQAAPGGTSSCLDADVIARDGELSAEMYRELLTRHWKDWVEFFNEWMLTEHVPAMHARLRAVAPCAEWVTYGIYPPYASTYKGAYFARYMGRDFSHGFEQFYNGPMLLEDYPYMCGYPLQRSVFMLTAMKLEAPHLKLYPEVYGVNGCASDARPVYGMPPYGHSHTPPGFFRKTVYEYAFAATWFDAGGFHYWQDNGFQAMAWTAAHYDEVVRTWGTVKRHPPARPLRTTAFAISRDVCLAHPDVFTETRANWDFEGGPCFHDMVNTAEEATAFAYEQARLDGQLAGFVLDLATVEKLDPADVHTLVLPPLTGVAADLQAAIRRLHAHGVALVGFEEAGDLADLFGIRRRAAPARVEAVRAAPRAGAENPWKLPDGVERCSLPHGLAQYDAADGDTWVDGLDAFGKTVAPVLVCRNGPLGRTAFFTIPPTMVKRLELKALASYGKESRSRLMNRAMALALRWVGRPAVETTAGKVIGFHGRDKQIHVIVMEDAHPAPGVTIRPVVTIRQPGLDAKDVQCDRDWYLVEEQPGFLRIGLELAPHESGHIRIH